jgi:two-component system, chemotaxis family, protein-glutamate methylesterase/glutaminase
MNVPPVLRGTIEAVVIGASAGGIQALSEILPAFPPASTVSVFVVIHLPRDRPSLLVDVFSPRCALKVKEAEDKEPVMPGTVYFAPANYHLLLEQGPHLALSVDDLVHHARPAIDVLFESAADVYRERLLGIILTGANEDGAEGLAAVRDAGGMTVVQDPQSAYAPMMLLSAIERRYPDLVLPLAGIAEVLRSLN